MAQLNGGSGSDESELDGADTATLDEDDTTIDPNRKLRDDARSDPMEDQTETEPSPEGTTATVKGGSEPSPRAPTSTSEPSSDPLDGSNDGSASQTTARPAQGAQRDDGDLGLPGDQRTRVDDLTDNQRRTISEARADVRRRIREEQDLGPGGAETFLGRDDEGDLVIRGRVTDEGAETIAKREAAERAEQGNAIDVGAAQDYSTRREAAEANQNEVLSELSAEVERDVERSVGSMRADALGVVNPRLRQGVIDATDLERGEDFTLEFDERRTDSGVTTTANVALTESRARAEAERAIELGAYRETGVGLEVGEGLRLVETEDGGFRAELTKEGQQQVIKEQPEEFGDIDWSFGLGDPKEDEVEQALDSVIRGIGEYGSRRAEALFGEGSIASESLGEEILIAAGEPELGQQYEEGLETVGRALVKGSVGLAAFPPAVAKAGIETVEYGVYGSQREAGPLYSQTRDAADEAVDEAVQYVKQNPLEAGAFGFASLGGTAALMRAGSLIGPRAGAATRYAIQPGEELAGSLGFRATRRLGGERRAEQLFPNREPLIFSEEFAIRQARNLRARAPDARARAADVVFGEPETRLVQGESSFSGFENSRLVRERPGLASQAGSAARGVRDAFSERTYAGLPIPRTELKTRPRSESRRPSTAAETESLLDRLDEDLRMFERAEGRRARDRLERARSRFHVEENTFRSRARELGFEAEVDTETTPVTRLELAQEASTQTDPLGLTAEAQSPLSRSDTRSELGTELDQRLAQELGVRSESRAELESELLLESEFESPMDLELELESELEFEFETELELELETESEIEAETLDLRPQRRPRDDTAQDILGSSTLIERELLNPFTGR